MYTQNKQKHKEENKSEMDVARVYKPNIWEAEREDSLL